MMQEYDGVKHPVMYASKKMLPREQNYSVGEREALAIVWAVNKFHRHLYNQHFILEGKRYAPAGPKTLSFFVCLFVCLSVMLFNVRVCASDFAMKALE